MKRTLLDFLACPDCRRALELAVFAEAGAAVEEGKLSCGACGRAYPVVQGIPRFVPNAQEQFPQFFEKHAAAMGLPAWGAKADFLRSHGSTQERFGFEWLNYPGALPEDRGVFLRETQIPASDWQGKRVLDAGCGMGRYARVAHDLGATVVALDLSVALIRLSDLAARSERMHLVQGNLMQPPFKADVFDVLYSIGVIHHTPDARETFLRLVPLVKKKGYFTLWLYGAPGRYSDFKTNPLREGREGLAKFRFPVWLIVHIREKLSDGLRLFTVHLPHRLLYALCHPLAWAGKIPFLKYLTFSVHSLWRVRLQENFDWLAPPYQSHHTKEELAGWFEENGFEVLKVLPHGFVPKPGILGRKK